MKNKKRSLILVACLLFSFYNMYSHHIESSDLTIKYYKDFDPIKLVGIEEINRNNVQFPFVLIEYINGHISRTCFFYKTDLKFSYDYEYLSGRYTRKYKMMDEALEFYDYYTGSSVVTIKAKISGEKKYFASVTISDKKGEMTFVMPDKKKLEFPDPYHLDYSSLKENCVKIISSTYLKNNEVIQFEEKAQLKDDNFSKTYGTKKCYESGGLSVFWWYYFGMYFKKMIC